jgi:ATP-binding cassette subfamily F protein 3
MLRLSNITKSYGDSVILQNVSFTLAAGQRIGIVGPNGCGKSTLLRLIARELESDSGSVSLHRDMKIGYLRQFIDRQTDLLPIGSYLVPEAFHAMERLHALEAEMAAPSDAEELKIEYVKAFEEFDSAGGWALENRIEQVLDGLAMPGLNLARPLNSVSGGQRTRLALARVLLLNADILLLDEPTNNLDTEAITWLEAGLTQTKAGCLIVSHDRRFLDATTVRTFEIDPLSHQIKEYGGNFSWYATRKMEEDERQRREYKEQQERIGKLKADIRATKDQAMATESSTQDDRLRRYAKKVAAKAKARETRLNRMISMEHKIDKPKKLERIRLSLSGHHLYNRLLIEAKQVSINYDNHPVLGDINLFVRGSTRIALTGANGSGKSSLLRVILGEQAPQSGEMKKQDNIRLCYLPQSDTGLPECKNVLEYFMDEVRHATSRSDLLDQGNARTFLHRFLFSGDQVFQKIGNLSQGERIKLMLAAFMAVNPEVLILDEPTNHLDIPSLRCLEAALKSFAGALIVVSHDRFFLSELALDTNWTIKDGSVHSMSTT